MLRCCPSGVLSEPFVRFKFALCSCQASQKSARTRDRSLTKSCGRYTPTYTHAHTQVHTHTHTHMCRRQKWLPRPFGRQFTAIRGKFYVFSMVRCEICVVLIALLALLWLLCFAGKCATSRTARFGSAGACSASTSSSSATCGASSRSATACRRPEFRTSRHESVGFTRVLNVQC